MPAWGNTDGHNQKPKWDYERESREQYVATVATGNTAGNNVLTFTYWDGTATSNLSNVISIGNFVTTAPIGANGYPGFFGANNTVASISGNTVTFTNNFYGTIASGATIQFDKPIAYNPNKTVELTYNQDTILVTPTRAANANTTIAASGNFSANTITATLNGNASTATSATSATSATTATTATQVSNSLTMAVSGTGLSGSATFNGSSAQTFTVTSNAASANGASTIVARDASGNFSAGTISAELNGNAATVTNGVYTTGSYANPSWITSIANTKISGLITSGQIATVANTQITGLLNASQVALGAVVNTLTGTTNQVTANSSTGNVLLSLPQNIHTGANVRFNSLGIGVAANNNTGEILAANNITSYYSDDRLKTRFNNIENALDKVMTLNGFYYQANETAQSLGYSNKREVGLSAQEVEKVLPEVIAPAPIDNQYMTIHYERVIPLLVEAIKELQAEVEKLKK